MNIDGNNEEPNTYYDFPSNGKHTVYMLLDMNKDVSLEKLFYLHYYHVWLSMHFRMISRLTESIIIIIQKIRLLL